MSQAYLDDDKCGSPLEKLEGEPVKIPVPDDLPALKPKPPKMLGEAETQASYGRFTPVRHVPYDEAGRWIAKIEVTPIQVLRPQNNTTLLMNDSRFVESQDGVFSVRNGKTQQQITNAVIRIVGIKRVWHTENDFDEFFICRVGCKDAWGNETYEIEIEKSDYKNLFRRIHQKYPEVFLSNQDVDSQEAYLTKVFQSKSELPVENVSKQIGWLTINGRPIYHMGVDPYYLKHEYKLPDVRYVDKRAVFLQGILFLQVGNLNNEICTLWIVVHIGHTLYWFDKAGVKFRSLLFLKGSTNLFKTAVSSVITNVFQMDRNDSFKRLDSTKASLQDYLSKNQDNTVLIDDFSNTVGANNKKMIENVEFIVRAVGDRQFPGKMSISDLSKTKDTKIRCVVIATGEEAFGLSTSSEYRMITLNVTEGTFDPRYLSPYQYDPNIMRTYFALYIQFLQENGARIVGHCKKNLALYRNRFRDIKIPRFIDAAVALSLQVDILQEFAKYCGANEETILRKCYDVIHSVLQQNQASSATGKPEVRFIKALMQSIGTDRFNTLADNEKLYAENESNFIGFLDKPNNQIWLRFADAFNLVRRFYSQLGEQFLTQESTIKELLVRQGIAVGTINENGGNQYLMRAKRGSRKYMLVLNLSRVQEVLKGVSF